MIPAAQNHTHTPTTITAQHTDNVSASTSQSSPPHGAVSVSAPPVVNKMNGGLITSELINAVGEIDQGRQEEKHSIHHKSDNSDPHGASVSMSSPSRLLVKNASKSSSKSSVSSPSLPPLPVKKKRKPQPKKPNTGRALHIQEMVVRSQAELLARNEAAKAAAAQAAERGETAETSTPLSPFSHFRSLHRNEARFHGMTSNEMESLLSAEWAAMDDATKQRIQADLLQSTDEKQQKQEKEKDKGKDTNSEKKKVKPGRKRGSENIKQDKDKRRSGTDKGSSSSKDKSKKKSSSKRKRESSSSSSSPAKKPRSSSLSSSSSSSSSFLPPAALDPSNPPSFSTSARLSKLLDLLHLPNSFNSNAQLAINKASELFVFHLAKSVMSTAEADPDNRVLRPEDFASVLNSRPDLQWLAWCFHGDPVMSKRYAAGWTAAKLLKKEGRQPIRKQPWKPRGTDPKKPDKRVKTEENKEKQQKHKRTILTADEQDIQQEEVAEEVEQARQVLPVQPGDSPSVPAASSRTVAQPVPKYVNNNEQKAREERARQVADGEALPLVDDDMLMIAADG